MTTFKTPAVFIQELDAFGDSVVPVPTAIPVFVGYTGQITFNGESIVNKAIKVSSLTQYFSIFGNTIPPVQFDLSKIAPGGSEEPDFHFGSTGDGYSVNVAAGDTVFRMDSAMKFFYSNGGADCYVLSVGGYDATPSVSDITAAIDLLKKETEPTMLLVPDAIGFSTGVKSDPLASQYAGAYSILNKMINHCGEDMPTRVAILDVPGGYIPSETAETPIIDAFRDNVNPTLPESNSYAAAYYPWLHTGIYQSTDLTAVNLSTMALALLKTTLTTEATLTDPKKKTTPDVVAIIATLTTALPPLKKGQTPTQAQKKAAGELKKADAAMRIVSRFYPLVLDSILNKLNLMGPSAAMAGIYTAVDHSDGVWKAPVKVIVQNVIAPAIMIDHYALEDLNAPFDGKSICAIQPIPPTSKGALVRGARTLDGNSHDFGHINVRRTLIYIEQSVKDAARKFVFAANDLNTWANVKSTISNFLTGVWKQGGLLSSNPAEAFSVSVGLGVTMSNDDIQNGIMRVSVEVAVTNPREFFIITFEQQQQ